jgi:hypothetical protein
MVIYFIFALLLLLLLALAVLPIRIEIDTGCEAFCKITVGILVHLSGEASQNGWYIIIQLPFFQRKIDVTAINTGSSGKSKQVKKQPSKLSSPLGMLKAFRLQKLEWYIDTGNYTLNAKLFPLLYLISQSPVKIAVNFNGQNRIVLKAYTRLYYLIVAFLKT